MPAMEQQEEAVLEAAAEHIRCDRLDAAEALLRARAAEHPGGAKVTKQLAVIAIKRGEPAKAAALIGDVLAANERDADAYSLLSAAYLAQGRAADALGSAERAHAIDPAKAMNLALAEQAAGHHDRAIARLEALVKEDPRSPELAYNLGTVYLDAGRLALARSELERATRLAPGRVAGWANLAAAEQALGNMTSALACIDQALLLDPESPLLLVSKAGMLSDTGDQAKAIDLADRAAALQPSATPPLITKGLALMRRGAWTAAAGVLIQAIRMEPKNAMATFALAVALRRQGKLAECLLALERAEQLGDGGGQARHDRARLLLQLGRTEEAFDLWGVRRASSTGVEHASSLEGLDRLLVLADPDPCVTVALIRYVPLLAARGLEVLVAAFDAQAGLVRRVDGSIATARVRALSPDDPVPDGIAVAALRRLPRLIGGTAEDVPRPGSYLRVEAPAVSSGLRIGVCTEAPADDWSPNGWGEPAFGEVVDALGDHGGEVIRLRPRAPLDELLDRIAGLDLVVAVDGEVAHLAGALGRPLIVLLDSGGGWAWPEGRDGSPWYPAARVLRQTSPGDFAPALARLGELAATLLGRPSPDP